MAKETAAQRVERLKVEKSGLNVLKDIHHYAATGEAVDSEDIDRFKWYGLYTQNKNMQEDEDETLYFMLRIRIVQGSINLEQLRMLSSISKEFARNTANFTTRQSVQLHFIQVRDLPEIFDRLTSVGLSTVYAAGDVPRNIVTCPVAGIDEHDIYDVREIVAEVNAYFNGNKDLENLPRKYKVGISGCAKHCMGHEIQDLSFSATKFEDGKVLFDVCVGGGLASNKQFAMHIGFVEDVNILKVVQAVSTIYRDHGIRENRRKARLGHLITKWGLEKFKEEVEGRLGFTFLEATTSEYTAYPQREHFGVHTSKIDGLSYIGCAVNGGSIKSKGLEDLANILEKHGATTIKTTTTQNFVILDAPSNSADAIVDDLHAIEIDANPNPFKARTLSCTGMQFCKFGISETKEAAISLSNHLHQKFPDFEETVSISMNGCPNSCAHPSIVDIGLTGAKFKDENGETIVGFDLLLGGTLEGNNSRYGKNMKYKIKPQDVNSKVEQIITSYIKSSQNHLGLYLKDLIEDDTFTMDNLK